MASFSRGRRQPDAKYAPPAQFAFGLNTAAVLFDYLFGDGQPQAAAGGGRLTHLFASIETVEDERQFFRGDPDAGVPHL